MDVEAVTTADQSLLGGVRSAIGDGADVLLCVAFVHSRGLRLVEQEIRRAATTRLVATTVFDQGEGAALTFAQSLGVDVRVKNPGAGSTYHPKVFLGRTGRSVTAFVGSANLTGGLVTNVEAGLVLKGTIHDPPLASLLEWGERLWSGAQLRELPAMAADAPDDDELDRNLLELIQAAVRANPVFPTLHTGAPNVVSHVTSSEVVVTTTRGTGPQSIPAWMFNTAWDWLRTNGELENRFLLKHLRVHRSSAVCAILARLKGVSQVPGRHVAIRLTP